MLIVSNLNSDRNFVIKPNLIVTIKKGSNTIDPEVAKLFDKGILDAMKAMKLEIKEDVVVSEGTEKIKEVADSPADEVVNEGSDETPKRRGRKA